jgi:hypothetical protein
MRGSQLRALGLSAALAVVFAACGGESAPEPDKGKVVSGETELGMKMTVQTFAVPGEKYPQLRDLEAYRAMARYPAVDYHRVTADNSAGSIADKGRAITFANSAEDVVATGGVQTRFSCDVLRYEWPVPEGAKQEVKRAYETLMTELCADGPPKPEGIEPGQRKVYYLITDRGFGQRGIETKRIFGPLNAEFVSAER